VTKSIYSKTLTSIPLVARAEIELDHADRTIAFDVLV
jgi:hypothetical protein